MFENRPIASVLMAGLITFLLGLWLLSLSGFTGFLAHHVAWLASVPTALA